MEVVFRPQRPPRYGYHTTPAPPPPVAGAPMSVRDFTRKHNAGVISRARRGANVAAFRFLDEHGFSRISEALLQLHNEIRAGDVRLSLRAGTARETIVVVVASIAEGELEQVLHFPNTGAMACVQFLHAPERGASQRLCR